MPPCCWSRPGRPPPAGFPPLARRPRRRLFLPPPPEGRPGPAFILFSLSPIQSARRGTRFADLEVTAVGGSLRRAKAHHVQKTPLRSKLLIDLVSVRRPEPLGAGGQPRGHGRWEHL